MRDSPLNWNYWPAWLIVVTLVAVYGSLIGVQVYRYRYVLTFTERQKVKWVYLGLVAALSGLTAQLLLVLYNPGLLNTISWTYFARGLLVALSLSLIPLSIGVAVLRHNLFDIDILINRTLVYSLLTACVVSLYAAIVGGLGALFQAQGSLLFSLLATGFIAVLFQTLRERLQRAINRLMYGERDEPYQVLTRLGQRLEAAIEPAAALPLTVETVAHALKLPYVAIKLKQAHMLQTAVSFGTIQNEVTVFPLVYAGETMGELIAAQRAPNEPLSPADHQLLHDLAQQISVTAHAILLSADLEQARQRIVATREEARRRLGSDLHDGVGHQLTGLARQVETAVSLLEQQPTIAGQMLTAVTQQLNAAISQVRHLAHQLHPPELELLGLAGALRERALTHPTLTIRLDAPESLPPLPPTVETAAYYIVLEALTNVEKYADVRVCRLRLELVDSELEIEVSDDGPGLMVGHTNGLGLLSMQARAAEVGGTCRIESSATGGTHVIACLPCPDQFL